MSKVETIYWCKERVSDRQGFGRYGCGHKAKHDPGPDGIPRHCGTHSAAAKAKRNAKSRSNYDAYRAKRDAAYAVSELRNQLEGVLREIAEGHNDPRAHANQALLKLTDARMIAANLGA